MLRRAALGCFLLATFSFGATSATAEPKGNQTSDYAAIRKMVDEALANTPVQFGHPRRLFIPKPDTDPAMAKPAALSGSTVFVNRCLGGCVLNPGQDDMPSLASRIVQSPTNVAEASDLTEPEWTGIMQCVKEVYSPYDVKVVDVKPGNEVAAYSGIIVAGNTANKLGAALGLPPDVGGVGGGGCTPDQRGVSFAFADNGNVNAFAQEVSGVITPESRILGLCWIIAQETAHNFGLPNHEFAYQDDNTSACNDPMTYRFECGGQKFFRNRFAICGEFPNDGRSPFPCTCGGTQNSHLKLLNTLGEGQSTIPAPVATMTTPSASSTAANSFPANIIASAGSERGVSRVELYLNGFKWAETKGAAFGRAGQPNPSTYTLMVPANVPNSIIDVQVKAFDDLELVGESPVITVVKGAAGGCTGADACLEGQKCEAGKCFWDPPAGELGDGCTFSEFCKSLQCSDSVIQGDGICTQPCVVGVEDSCPMGLQCVAVGNGGICYTDSGGGGCCSASSGGTPWAPFLFGGTVLGFIVIRRRRR